MFCRKCGTEIKRSAKFCANCGQAVHPKSSLSDFSKNRKIIYSQPKLDKKLENRNSLKDDTFAKTLFVGTPSTTPFINEIRPVFPVPSLFLRLLIPSLLCLILFFSLWSLGLTDIGFFGILLIGCFVIPISTLILFFELNIRKNIPIWTVARIGLFGGIISFFLTITINNLTGLTGVWSAGITEEPAKLISLILLTGGGKKYPYILNGLLLGAAVGCTFSSFESVQYAINSDNALNNIMIRGGLSPFMHIAWTSLAGAAIWRVQKGAMFRLDLIQKTGFLVPFLIVILLHIIWNSFAHTLIPGFWLGGYVLLGIFVWLMIVIFVNLGIKEIANEQRGKGSICQ